MLSVEEVYFRVSKVMADNNEPRNPTPGAPPRSLVAFIVTSACLSVVFFLLVLACPLNVAKVETATGWTTLTGRAPFITFALLAGFGSTEFANKLTDLADSLFALSKKRDKE